MACFSTSLQDVVEKSNEARQQVEKLQKGLNESDAYYEGIFKEKRDEFFQLAGLDDIESDGVNQNIKVEFASEFSLDKIIPVVQAAIDAAVATYAPGSPINPKTKEAFTDLVVAIGECAKFSSKATASMSFAVNRLLPGLFVSLYAGSVTIDDRNMFGKKAVTATMYYYQLSKSNKDIENDMNRELMLMYAKSVISLNKKILELADQVADGTMSMQDFEERRQTIKMLIDQHKPVVASYKKGKSGYQEAIVEIVEREGKITHKVLPETERSGRVVETVSIDMAALIDAYNDSLTDLLQ